MLASLSCDLNNFPGAANQTRCFAHTVSISAKSIIQQFDTPKYKSGEVDDGAAEALAALYKDLEVEEREERKEEEHQRNDDEDEDEPLLMWEEYGEALTEEQRKEHDASIQPVQSMLVKVIISYPNPMITNQCLPYLRKISFAVKNSTIILLPKWYQTLTAHGLPHRIIPRDVATRWNSTFDMLDFAVKYCPAINTMTAARDLGLRNYELHQVEWKIAEDLGGVLKVS
jgi:hypothetical protein